MTNWTTQALCKKDPRFTSYELSEVNEAIKICKSCEVQKECAEYTAKSGGLFVSAGTDRFDRLMLQWQRIENVNDSILQGDHVALREILRRV